MGSKSFGWNWEMSGTTLDNAYTCGGGKCSDALMFDGGQGETGSEW